MAEKTLANYFAGVVGASANEVYVVPYFEWPLLIDLAANNEPIEDLVYIGHGVPTNIVPYTNTQMSIFSIVPYTGVSGASFAAIANLFAATLESIQIFSCMGAADYGPNNSSFIDELYDNLLRNVNIMGYKGLMEWEFSDALDDFEIYPQSAVEWLP